LDTYLAVRTFQNCTYGPRLLFERS